MHWHAPVYDSNCLHPVHSKMLNLVILDAGASHRSKKLSLLRERFAVIFKFFSLVSDLKVVYNLSWRS